MLFAFFMKFKFLLLFVSVKLTVAYSELGYSSYISEGNSDVLYRPFINVYFGVAYIQWLSNFEDM